MNAPMLWRPDAAFDAAALDALEAALDERLAAIAARFPRAVLASSLSAEDMVLLEAIARGGLTIDVFVIDTGRLHPETLALLNAAQRRYGRVIEVFAPDAQSVADYVSAHGADAFYGSPALRQSCCGTRKVEPLARALAGHPAWLTGQRRAQDAGRAALPFEEHDARHGIAKFNPLADWPDAAVWAQVARRAIPVNALHARGYPSIGCAPCTRPIRAHEDIRAGRWWWEGADHKECGLHVAAPARTPESLAQESSA
jgi:phosphoadenosine phosphosulfate reductase